MSVQSLYTLFKTSIRPSLVANMNKSNIHDVPVLDKVVVAMGVGSLVTRKNVKDLSDLESNLAMITGQHPQTIMSKKAVSNFKLRVGQPVMLRSTLRGERAYDFVDRLVKYVLPRVRDFVGLSVRKFDGGGNLHFGLTSQAVFPELSPDDIKTPQGLQISLCTTANSDDDAQAVLESLGLLFQK